MNRQQETECLSYFRGSGIWDRILVGFWDKYSSYGYFGGRVLLRSLSREDVETLEGFFGKSFHGQKSVTVSAENFQKALEKSRFEGIQPKRLLELYFHEKPKGKKEIRREEERKQAEILQELKVYCQGTPAEDQLEVIKAILSTGRNKGTKEWRRLLFLGARMVNALPCHRGEYLYLAVFAAQLTGNPHAFDAGTIEGNLLRQLVKVLSEKEKKSDPGLFPAFEKQQEYLQAGILLDDMSNYTTLYGVQGWKRNSELHPGLEGFFREKEVAQIPLNVLVHLGKLKCLEDTLYIVENPSVFSMLISEKAGKRSCMCMNGQPRLSSLIALQLLEKEGTTIYYGGDFDPEGLMIAQKLALFYPGEFHYWHMEPADYEQCKSREAISESRLRMLEKITDERLKPVVEQMKIEKVAGYQELIDFFGN